MCAGAHLHFQYEPLAWAETKYQIPCQTQEVRNRDTLNDTASLQQRSKINMRCSEVQSHLRVGKAVLKDLKRLGSPTWAQPLKIFPKFIIKATWKKLLLMFTYPLKQSMLFLWPIWTHTLCNYWLCMARQGCDSSRDSKVSKFARIFLSACQWRVVSMATSNKPNNSLAVRGSQYTCWHYSEYVVFTFIKPTIASPLLHLTGYGYVQLICLPKDEVWADQSPFWSMVSEDPFTFANDTWHTLWARFARNFPSVMEGLR